ncbi:MAG: spore protease YyaC [Gorillibacterium sp.]|nr:spore protease YyaC [Gorillibacterium sp.]
MKLSPEYDASPSFTPHIFPGDEAKVAMRIANLLSGCFQKIPNYRPVVFVCIGTDRSTGDSLGPLVGSRLKKYNFSDITLYGTLEFPVHAMNLSETVSEIKRDHNDPFIVGIDACLGQLASVGNVKVSPGPLKPGAGVNKELPEVGHMHITGIVNVGGFMEYFVLQNTRLNLVFNLAEVIAKAIYLSLLHCGRITLFSSPALSRE